MYLFQMQEVRIYCTPMGKYLIRIKNKDNKAVLINCFLCHDVENKQAFSIGTIKYSVFRKIFPLFINSFLFAI